MYNKENKKLSTIIAMEVVVYFSKIADDDEKAQAHFDKITEILGDNTWQR